MEEKILISDEISQRAAVHAALGEPVRLAIVESLRLSDRAPSDLAKCLGLDSNLLAHHLEVLTRAGLIERVISTGDRRRRYIRLNHAVLPGHSNPNRLPASTILFVCTHNSARSQLAAALWNHKTARIADSAGTHPASTVHPLAIAVAAQHGIDLSTAQPRSLFDVTTVPDLMVTVCDRANEELVPQATVRLHWSIPDPASVGALEAFEQAFQTLEHRVAGLIDSVLVSA